MNNLLSLKPYLLRYKKNLWSGFLFIILTNLFAVIAPNYIGLCHRHHEQAISNFRMFSAIPVSTFSFPF